MVNIAGHAILKIMKGIAKVPQDANSAEQGLDEIDLLDPNGFACDDYDMKIPALKSSAVYADSPLTDGRTLISGALGNVTETIRCELTAGSIVQLAAMLSRLGRFKQDCNDFWDTFNQIEPIYLKHQVVGEPGPRHALLYDIDIDVDTPIDPSKPMRTVTIVIEREFGWRGIAPGDNPKKWTAYVHGAPFNADYSDLTGITNDDHLVIRTDVSNFQELSTFNTFLTTNFITIPGDLIPGDLPALTLIQSGTAATYSGVIISRDTKPLTLNDTIGGVSQLRKLDLIAAAGTLGTNAAFVTDATGGMRKLSVSANRRRVDVTYVNPASVLRWSIQADMALMRGRFMVFARIRQYAGAQNDLRYYINIRSANDTFYTSDTNKAPILAGSIADLANNPIDYLGIVTIPAVNSAAIQMRNGRGLLISDESSAVGTQNFVVFELWSSRVAGTTAQLAFYDFILVPMDECAMQTMPGNVGGGTALLDNTGYLTHGVPELAAQRRSYIGAGVPDQIDNNEPSGQPITLIPGKTNYLYMLKLDNTHFSRTFSTDAFRFILDIVPRWSGLRDR
jgi:hypothetical protein